MRKRAWLVPTGMINRYDQIFLMAHSAARCRNAHSSVQQPGALDRYCDAELIRDPDRAPYFAHLLPIFHRKDGRVKSEESPCPFLEAKPKQCQVSVPIFNINSRGWISLATRSKLG